MLNRIFNHLLAPKLALAASKQVAGKRGLYAFQVLGANMAPTIEPEDIAWFEASHKTTVPSRGQVVVLRLIEFGSSLVPSRVVALPGETIELRDGSLFVNQEFVEEPYLQFGRAKQDYSRYFQSTSVPEAHLWLLGDFRDMSKDSRSFGPVPLSAVVGRITHAHQRGGHNRPREVR